MKSWIYRFIYFGIAALLIIASHYQLFLYIRHTPVEFYQTYVNSDWPHDYYSHLSYITTAMHGEWQRVDLYTSEPTKPSLMHWYYTPVGFLARVLGISSVAAYQTSRLLTVIAFVIGIYYLATRFFSGWPAVAAGIFSLIGASSPGWLLDPRVELELHPYGYRWWWVLNPLERLSEPAHRMAGYALLTFGMAILIAFVNKPSAVKLGATLVCFTLASFFFPPSMLPIGLVSLGVAISTIVRKIKGLSLPKGGLQVILSSLLLIVVLQGGLYVLFRLQEQLGFPWYTTNAFDLVWNKSEDYKFLPLVFGILLPLALPAALRHIIKISLSGIVIVFWAATPFLIFPIADLLGVGKDRILMIAPFVPLTILSAQSILTFAPSIGRRQWIVPIVGSLLIILTSLPVAIGQVAIRVRGIDGYIKRGMLTWIMPTVSEVSTFRDLDKILPEKSVVLSYQRIGNMLPAFAYLKTYVGHPGYTLDYDKKLNSAWKFFSRTLTASDAQEYLRQGNVSYIWVGDNERMGASPDALPQAYPFLKLIYEREAIQVYKVP